MDTNLKEKRNKRKSSFTSKQNVSLNKKWKKVEKSFWIVFKLKKKEKVYTSSFRHGEKEAIKKAIHQIPQANPVFLISFI